MSRFGLIEMTRQRVRPSILHTINDNCPVCHGSGLVPTMNTIVARLERWIQRYRSGRGDRRITVRMTEDVQHYLTQGRYNRRLRLMWKYWMKLNLVADNSISMGSFRVFDRNNEKEIELQN
jgi:ribonuclease G